MKRSQVTLYLIALFCVTAWGSNFVFGSILVGQFNPGIIAILRLFFILLFLYPLTRRHVKGSHPGRNGWLLLVIGGLVGVSFNQWSFYASLHYTDPVIASLILALSPIVTVALSGFFLKEKRGFLFWAGAGVGLAGVWLVITKGTGFVPSIGKGEWLIGGTMLSFSIFLLLVQRMSATMETGVITWYTNLFGLIGLLPFVSWGALPEARLVGMEFWVMLVVTAIVMHGLCTYLWNGVIREAGASNIALLLNLEPFIAMLASYLLLGNLMSVVQVVGGLIIIAGILLSIRSRR
ncbi:membrane protein [Sporosarcina sp. NCCP-2716]|uniref:DMT family transporter n=1 Tax=Sporosarcina sp. NCCP-2716 TaxID=2943679 RepID=UPI00203E8B8B|nr:DMT family transporter [Sporosarcina sp. NCCP-2716]GKV70559.1 membrane protein [Sporosarcina sp. NCCP-2716]